ncbi:MAG: helix-turn-helix domain-containing protein, partial [Oscillospiraceae bacterium]|nr:helix-turn-helix domain-containing protein [Oscillospiraceae bacterium]
MTKNVKMQDIADRLGISVVAVSKALSGKSGVSEALRDEVRRTAGELGYSYTVRRKQPGNLTGNVCVLASSRFIDEDSFYLK